jgi:hypothetical protein
MRSDAPYSYWRGVSVAEELMRPRHPQCEIKKALNKYPVKSRPGELQKMCASNKLKP